MRRKILFSGKYKKNIINLLSAEFAYSMLCIKLPIITAATIILIYIPFFFPEKIKLDIVEHLPYFTIVQIKFYFFVIIGPIVWYI